jgi:hypothetical protein
MILSEGWIIQIEICFAGGFAGRLEMFIRSGFAATATTFRIRFPSLDGHSHLANNRMSSQE